MASHFSLEQVTRLRDSARILNDQADGHETDVGQLLEAAEANVRAVNAELSALDRTPGGAREFLQHQAARAAAQVAIARRLCLAARKHHLATTRMVSDLGDRDERPTGERSLSHAVLIADDHEDSREWLSMILQDAGYIVCTASDGLEALLSACAVQPAVIVMDLMMPVLDGVEATRLIKACADLKHVRVIAYSAAPAVRPPNSAHLFSSFLPKPSPPELIVKSVHETIGAA